MSAVQEVFALPILTALVAGAVTAGVPLLLAALGEAISERGGVLNIGLEGMMLVGAYTGFWATLRWGSPWIGFLAAITAGLLFGAAMAALCVGLNLDQIVVGIALLIVAQGATSVLHRARYGASYPRLDAVPPLEVPLLSKVPVVGAGLFSQQPVVYLAFGLLVVVALLLRATSFGLHLGAAGEDPEALDAAGVSVAWTRTAGVLVAGALAGLGGGFVGIVGAGIFVPFMTHGAGFIAIVIAMLARGRPIWIAMLALVFGGALSLATALQLVGVSVSIDLLNALPFVAVLLVMFLFARGKALPGALGRPYRRGSRI
ncbi:MAG: ABC transporter permease [Thermoleophilia bacterium]